MKKYTNIKDLNEDLKSGKIKKGEEIILDERTLVKEAYSYKMKVLSRAIPKIIKLLPKNQITKTETQTAEENIYYKRKGYIGTLTVYQSHKATIQRFLKFLKSLENKNKVEFPLAEDYNYFNDKTTDLKQAIKLYEDKGI